MMSKSGTESKPGGGQVTDPVVLEGCAAAWVLAKRKRERAADTSDPRLVKMNGFMDYADRTDQDAIDRSKIGRSGRSGRDSRTAATHFEW